MQPNRDRLAVARVLWGLILAALLLTASAQAQQMPPPGRGTEPELPGATQSRPSPQAEPDGAAAESETEVKQFSFPVRIIEDPKDAKRREEEERRAEEREQSDLDAQRSMADSARKMLNPAWWQVAIAGIGALLISLSLLYSAKQTKAATVAANAAVEANRLNRMAFIEGERAWILIKDVRIESPLTWIGQKNGSDKTGQITVKITLKNIGKSPALNAFVWAETRPNIMLSSTIEKVYRDIAHKERVNPTPPDWGKTLFQNHEYEVIWTLAVTDSTAMDITAIDSAATGSKASLKRALTSVLLVVCITYEIIFSRERRQTGLAVPITSPTADRFLRRIGPEVGEVPAEQLSLTFSFGNDTFVD